MKKKQIKVHPPFKKAMIYARVSSQKQKDEETIDSQFDALKQYADENQYFVEDKFIFLDNGVSGSKLQRPALDELRDVIRFENIDAILIYAPDRLARDYTHQLILLEEFRKNGVQVYFLKNAPLADTPEAKMFQHFQGIFAEYERALFLDRSRRGRIYKAKKGDVSVLPSVPYGYRKIKKDDCTVVVILEDEVKVVKEIYRLYTRELCSLNEVARRITESGIIPRKGGAKWDMATIRDILKNPTYLGTAHFGKTEKGEGKTDIIRKYGSKIYSKAKYARIKRPEDEWIPINVPQIITENDFEQASERLKLNKKNSSRNTKTPALLQGLIVCGICGQPFYKRTKNNRNKTLGYYYCRGNAGRKYDKCSNKSLRQDEIDAHVFAEVLQLLKNPTLIEQELLRRIKEATDEKDPKQEILLNKELSKIKIERDRLLDAYQNGVIDIQDLKMRNQILEKKKRSLEKEIQSLEVLRENKDKVFEISVLFDTILQKLRIKEASLSFVEQRKIIRLLVEKIVVYSDTINIIHCVSPMTIAQNECLLKVDGV